MTAHHNRKYSGVAMTLHWLVAIAVIATIIVTQVAEDAPTREARGEIMANHFALGVIIFALVLARFVWRMVNPPPPQNPAHAGWERALAKITHLAIYAFLLMMPLAGWYAMSKYGSGLNVFGLFEVPPLPVEPDPEAAGEIFEIHELAGKILIGLIALHILGALKHTIVDKDGTIFRMLPFGEVKG